MTRDSTSRPRSSVPKTWDQFAYCVPARTGNGHHGGAWSVSSSTCSIGLFGEIHWAVSAMKTSTTRTPSPSLAPRTWSSRVKNWRCARKEMRPALSASAEAPSRAACSGAELTWTISVVPHARIEHAVQQIGDQVREEDRRADQQHHGLHD